MNRTHHILMTLLLMLVATTTAMAQRQFKHPGLSFTQSDLDRMKAMYEAKVEPFYSAFIDLRDNNMYTRYRDIDREFPKDNNGKPIIWENPNLWLDGFGQIARNNALIYHVTGDTYYADRAVMALNRYADIRSVKTYGTNPLDASKAYLLIEGAELMRDYAGWKAEDQQAFKDFLVCPGYSTIENYYEKYGTSVPETNQVTIYWNIFQGDPQRHGNQGLYAMRCLLAMGIYLDNDTIYDRAYRKIMSYKHRKDDLAYPKGPNYQGAQNSQMPDYYLSWKLESQGEIEDYGSDDELKYWIYENGQCQEASRDQGHITDGMVGITHIAKMAWNQGDDLFTAYDNRILKGINYVAHYNYSWINNHQKNEAYFQGVEDFEPTVENGQFLRRRSRNNRFESLKINPYSENSYTWTRHKRFKYPTQMYTAYKYIIGVPEDEMRWLQRAYDMDMDSLRLAGADASKEEVFMHYRTAWMAGDGGTFVEGRHKSGLPKMPGTLKAVDYDFYNDSLSGNGHTYYNNMARADEWLYRKEGGISIKAEGKDYSLTHLSDGAWMNYTFSLSKTGTYELSVEADVKKDVTIGFSVDGSNITSTTIPAGSGYQSLTIGKQQIEAGARVLRLYVTGADNAVDIKTITIAASTADKEIVGYQWNSRDYTATTGSILTDRGADNLYSTSYGSAAAVNVGITTRNLLYRIGCPRNYLVIKGNSNLLYAMMTAASFRTSDAGSDVSKTSSAGIQQHFKAVSEADDGTILAWKCDSANVGRNVKSLLLSAYSGANTDYILRNLTINLFGKSSHVTTSIDDINFYTSDEAVAKYPELSEDIPTAIIQIPSSATHHTSPEYYNLAGQCVSETFKGIVINNNKKIINN